MASGVATTRCSLGKNHNPSGEAIVPPISIALDVIECISENSKQWLKGCVTKNTKT